jgi:DNA (cytosine-5)-methyltransferase 1
LTAVEPSTGPALAARDAPSPKALELFAGAGGMALGIHRAGFELVDLIENNEASCRTLRSNADLLGWKDPGQLGARDVRDLDWADYRDLDLLCAGAPCQPFSRGSKHRRGKHDERNMLGEVVKAVAITRPKLFVIENVRGLLFESQVGYFKSILARLRRPTVDDPSTPGSEDLYWSRAPAVSSDDDYIVDFRVLDAADFGLPQRRPRLFIVGIRTDIKPGFEWPQGRFSRESLIEDIRGGSYWDGFSGVSKAAMARARAGLPRQPLKRNGQRWRTLRDLTEELGAPAAPGSAVEDPSHVLVRGARLYGKHTGSRIDWVGKTVKAGVHGSPGGEHILLQSPKRYRYLTVRECARLQGFPNAFVLPELRTPAMRQLGNAVPVAVAAALGENLRAVLDNT